ncbi:hypothetical protein B0H13DRAFT_1914765 [Mycena leptocephala]|nr:hypothetical protein B0H13DRAFT_1914765 [Mycena leptocephala]
MAETLPESHFLVIRGRRTWSNFEERRFTAVVALVEASRAETRRQKSRGPWSLESDRDGRSEQAVVEAAAKYGPAAIAALPQHMTKLRLIMPPHLSFSSNSSNAGIKNLGGEPRRTTGGNSVTTSVGSGDVNADNLGRLKAALGERRTTKPAFPTSPPRPNPPCATLSALASASAPAPAAARVNLAKCRRERIMLPPSADGVRANVGDSFGEIGIQARKWEPVELHEEPVDVQDHERELFQVHLRRLQAPQTA